MWQDPIVAETRALRDEYARQFNYDAAAIYQRLFRLRFASLIAPLTIAYCNQ